LDEALDEAVAAHDAAHKERVHPYHSGTNNCFHYAVSFLNSVRFRGHADHTRHTTDRARSARATVCARTPASPRFCFSTAAAAASCVVRRALRTHPCRLRASKRPGATTAIKEASAGVGVGASVSEYDTDGVCLGYIDVTQTIVCLGYTDVTQTIYCGTLLAFIRPGGPPGSPRNGVLELGCTIH
jgi:hypothetical protein